MPTLKDIRRRITSVEKTQQITSAMRMVAAAKLRRAENAIKAARPYASRMRETLGEVAGSSPDADHPLLAVRDAVRSVEFVVITSDRGLCAAFNANAIKRAEALIAERQHGIDSLSVTAIGRKASEHFVRRHADAVAHKCEIGSGWIAYDFAAEIAHRLAQRYIDGEIDQVVLVFNQFESVMTQRTIDQVLLPLRPEEAERPQDADQAEEGEETPLPYSIEPNPEQLLSTLVPKAIEVEIFRALLENQAGEHAARMTAMESATRNTEDLIEELTLQYNRARQAAITKELVEIVSGAEAL